MAKKKSSVRKPTGTAAIKVVEDEQDELHHDDTANGSEPSPTADQIQVERKVAKPPRKNKSESQSGDNLILGDIRKAAAFANSVGGLDKAIALLQILKVAKDVQ